MQRHMDYKYTYVASNVAYLHPHSIVPSRSESFVNNLFFIHLLLPWETLFPFSFPWQFFWFQGERDQVTNDLTWWKCASCICIHQHFIRKRKEQRFDGFLRIILTCRWLGLCRWKKKRIWGFHQSPQYFVFCENLIWNTSETCQYGCNIITTKRS